MSRHRFLVALVPSGTLLDQVRGVRLLGGGVAAERIVPHVTLVAPFNLAADAYDELRRHLRAVATRTAAFDLSLGPASSFAPLTPTLHLEVHGDGSVERLHDELSSGPGARPEGRPFVPHLTLARRATEAQIAAGPVVLGGQLPAWRVEAMTLMVQVSDESDTQWRPVTEEPFGGPVVVGRGGVELHLRTVSLLEAGGVTPAVAVEVPDGSTVLATLAEPAGAPGVILGAVHGHVVGDVARLCGIEVEPSRRGRGIGRHLLERWMTDAGRRGARIVLGTPSDPGYLASVGFSVVGRHVVRDIPGSSG